MELTDEERERVGELDAEALRSKAPLSDNLDVVVSSAMQVGSCAALPSFFDSKGCAVALTVVISTCFDACSKGSAGGSGGRGEVRLKMWADRGLGAALR